MASHIISTVNVGVCSYSRPVLPAETKLQLFVGKKTVWSPDTVRPLWRECSFQLLKVIEFQSLNQPAVGLVTIPAELFRLFITRRPT
jgi:hypothetical protein